MDKTGSVHQVNFRSGEGSSNGMNTDLEPPIQVAESTRGTCGPVDAAQSLSSERALGRVTVPIQSNIGTNALAQ